ncbi:MAG: PDZ domain-containing protein [Gemmatimonadales bacterium]
MIVSTRLLTLAGLCAATALPSAAQQRQTRVWVNGQEVSPFELITGRRARIGVTLDMYAFANDTVGATIVSVTPGGPADDAGIRSGDIITRFNGRSLVPGGSDRDRREDESLAALRLIEMMAQVEPGDSITLDYRRDGRGRSTIVVAERERDLMAGGTLRLEGDAPFAIERMPRLSVGRGPRDFFFSFGGPMADVELAQLNDDLGSYFGTAEGVLVISAPTENPFGLKGGDVIVSVDGRAARSPASLLRVLSTYDDGEAVRLEILRNRNRQTISSKVERRR